MVVLELLCLAIVGIHLTVAALRAQAPGVYIRRAALVAVASWIAEDTCIRLYGFYAYSPQWVPFVDRMPLMVALIWPGVLLSAWEVAGLLLGREHRRVPLAAAAIVLADASFMEPIAVRSGLWTWYEPGFFGVPPIGVLGWAFFSFICIGIFHRNDVRASLHAGHDAHGRAASDLLVLALAPAALHPLLLGAWWGALRWVNYPIPGWAVAALAWAMGLYLALRAVRSAARDRIPIGAMATRIPAAAFFFTLLMLYGNSDGSLIAYALAFAPPYFALTRLRSSTKEQRVDKAKGL